MALGSFPTKVARGIAVVNKNPKSGLFADAPLLCRRHRGGLGVDLRQDLPSSSSLDLSTLRGMALHDSRFIWRFPADALSTHPATRYASRNYLSKRSHDFNLSFSTGRFKALFLEREKWKREDILPYVEVRLRQEGRRDGREKKKKKN